MEKGTKVCVTGGAGYLGSWLVNKLLQKGYTVHATLRNLDDPSKVGLLNSFPYADTRLQLFEADIYNPEDFERAIDGCDFVFHVATPLLHNTESSKYKDTVEAAVAGVKGIMACCARSGLVKRVIYTGSVMAASPLKDDGTGFKDSLDESCWTPLNLSFVNCTDFEQAYICSKTLAEKEVLSYCEKEKGNIEVVSLACGLVGGDTLLPYVPGSLGTLISQLTCKIANYKQLKLLQELSGSVPLVHIDDVCEAHVFCMETPSITGRFLCASTYPTTVEIATFYQNNHKELEIAKEFVEGPERGVQYASTKLIDMGFQYKYDLDEILDGSMQCAMKLGSLK
eukprot:TRINITY_DN771_c0_g1_i2.p1 TRINITY_DN771_c0_g1~~TRINITY_DN771_c0_g1_i2.p1  ORF type:complete len:339 (-),score=48.59 TRINITY_DN771_c0_g1_i2:137-1153(-)